MVYGAGVSNSKSKSDACSSIITNLIGFSSWIISSSNDTNAESMAGFEISSTLDRSRLVEISVISSIVWMLRIVASSGNSTEILLVSFISLISWFQITGFPISIGSCSSNTSSLVAS